ncbi:NADH:ubiquinone oxidoreductase subunit 2 (subunit N) [Lewinella marina]|uniref:Uncharacterized protein n=1 Tax=Neolewinella marina TaxID=438751 RepID=A0A2G0CCK1_9BACT|nr:hypothetical protein [Neolewinella marina]NJB87633.1 NADH:ubiquinone oxidoreductase subunit 2 (subunit N) [Neolewinella marina]PHK97682.1 hypothetical protein CGL56_14730 [Neolewinella marina]
MEDNRRRRRGKFHAALAWVPILVYFVVKYLVFGNEMPQNQWIALIVAVILAEVALWQYRRRDLQNPPSDGTD